MYEDDPKIVVFPGFTTVDLPAEQVLQSAIDAKIPEVIVLGWDQEETIYIASNKSRRADALYLLEVAKKFLLDN